jgi:acyl-CoA synthetase (AMP-forming)/AMP-acid ligase II
VNWNLATVWESVADAVPDNLALVQGDNRRSWRAFDDRSARLANGLRAAGVGTGSKVASYLYNGNEYLEGLYASFKLRAVPVNVNYRYLEDELVYLLDNSDAEALLFHGSLGERVAKIRDRAPKVKLWVQVDDGAPMQEFAVAFEDLVANNEPMERIERSGDDYYFLYTGGTTGMPKGVMWRNEDLYGVLGDTVYALVGAQTPDSSDGAGAIAQSIVEKLGARVHLPASPLMHGTGAFSSFQAMFLGGAIATLEGRHFDPHELWRVVERERVTQMAIVGDAFAKPMVRALEEAAANGKPYDASSVQLIISSGVIWSAEVKQQLIAHANCLCLDSLGSSEGVGFANSIAAPGNEQATAIFPSGAQPKVV